MIYTSEIFMLRKFLNTAGEDVTLFTGELQEKNLKIHSITTSTNSSLTNIELSLKIDCPQPMTFSIPVTLSKVWITSIPQFSGTANGIELNPPAPIEPVPPVNLLNSCPGFLKQMKDENGNPYLLIPNDCTLKASLNVNAPVSIIIIGEY